jgi:Na+-transporting methylmalonyl-CoA/oxaloacetate decarboxylase gamma subunit
MLLAEHNDRALIRFTLEPLLEEHGLALAVLGVLVVFVALALVVAFISLLPLMLRRFSVADQDELSSLAGPRDEGELSEEIQVVIAAAVAEIIQQPHRVVRIRGLSPTDLGWSLEGRIQHHESHRLQHRDRG